MNIALLGGGKMGGALLAGLLEAGFAADALAVAEVDAARRAELEAAHQGVRLFPSVAWAVADAEVVVVATKPDDVVDVLRSAREALAPSALVVSIAAGVTLATLEECLPDNPVVRAMPNTPALAGVGACAIAAGSAAGETHLEVAERVLGAVGTVERVDEPDLDAVTGLSGSGPAYVFLVAEALIEAGVLNGLARPVAERLVGQTLLGAATLLAAEGDPAALRAAVTSPGGTTAAGLAALESRAVRSALVEAVSAATRRSRELGR